MGQNDQTGRQARLEAPAQVKALGDGEPEGTFEALVAVFGNVDLGGDRIKRGAFRNSIKRWRAKGDPVPIILSHDWGNPWSHIGVADPKNIKETPGGLMVKGTLDVGHNDVAQQVYRLMKRRSLTGWSFGYEVRDGDFNEKEDCYDLRELELFEAGPTLRGMNPEAQLQGVKSALASERQAHEAAPAAPAPTPPAPELTEPTDGVKKESQQARLQAAMSGVTADASTSEVPGLDQEAIVEAATKAALAAVQAQDEQAPKQGVLKDSQEARLELAMTGVAAEPSEAVDPELQKQQRDAAVKAAVDAAVQEKVAEAVAAAEAAAAAAKTTEDAEVADNGALRKASQQERLSQAMAGVDAQPSPPPEPEPDPTPVDQVRRADQRRRLATYTQ